MAVDEAWPRSPRAYLSLIACFGLMFLSWGNVNAYGTYLSFYSQHLLIQSGEIPLNLIGSTQCAIILGLSLVHGVLLDAGYHRILIIVGTALFALGDFLISIGSPGSGDLKGSGNFGVIYVCQGIILSLGMSCYFVASSQIIATWFPKRKPVAVCIVACGASVAGSVVPFTIKGLLPHIGFNNAVRVAAGIATSVALFAIMFATPNPAAPIRKPTKWLAKDTWFDGHSWRNRAYLWYVAAMASMFMGFYAIFFNLEEWAFSNGFGYRDQLPNSDATPESSTKPGAIRVFYLLAIMNGASSVGRLAGGWFALHHGTVFAHAVVMSIASLLCAVWWPLVDTTNAAIAWVVVFGAVSGAVIGLPPASVMHILENDLGADRSRLGQWIGMMYTCAAPAALFGPLIAGAIINKSGYLGLQLYSGACLGIAAVCIIMSVLSAKDIPVTEQLRQGASGTLRKLCSCFGRNRQAERKDSDASKVEKPPPDRMDSLVPILKETRTASVC